MEHANHMPDAPVFPLILPEPGGQTGIQLYCLEGKRQHSLQVGIPHAEIIQIKSSSGIRQPLHGFLQFSRTCRPHPLRKLNPKPPCQHTVMLQ